MTNTQRLALEAVIYREDLYPRIKHSQELIDRYAANLGVLPPIEVNQHNELIDGWHRWTAHRKEGAPDIAVTVTHTASEPEFYALAIRRNAAHGLQMTEDDKKRAALRLFNAGEGLKPGDIAEVLSVSERMVSSYLADAKRQLREEQLRIVRECYLRCDTQQQIAARVKMSQQWVDKEVRDLPQMEALPKMVKLAALYEDVDWSPPLYDVWSFNKDGNDRDHFGKSHVGIVDNLLYTFTQPFDIVIDPFAGGGSTVDICQKRMRRYWTSDRKVTPGREDDIRLHDLIKADGTVDISGPYNQWADVALVYLDPPYWRQAKGQYSDDQTDLGNMGLKDFHDRLVGIINAYGKKLKPGAHLACLIQPTQWLADDRQQPAYHDYELVNRITTPLTLIRRAVCPYPTQQYNAQQVEAAKAEKLWLIISRTLLVWKRS